MVQPNYKLMRSNNFFSVLWHLLLVLLLTSNCQYAFA